MAEDASEADTFYDEVEIEDMVFDTATQLYHFPCPCGDRFEIAIADLRDGADVAVCPSCSLMIRVVFDVDDLPKLKDDEQEQEKEDVSSNHPPQVALVAA